MHTVNTSVQTDGQRRSNVYFYLASDGRSAELQCSPVLDLKQDIIPVGQRTNITIEQIWWCNTGFDVLVLSSDAPDVPLWVLPAGTDSHIDFRGMGGLRLPTGMDDTQKLLFSTRGFGEEDSKKGTIILSIRKD